MLKQKAPTNWIARIGSCVLNICNPKYKYVSLIRSLNSANIIKYLLYICLLGIN